MLLIDIWGYEFFIIGIFGDFGLVLVLMFIDLFWGRFWEILVILRVCDDIGIDGIIGVLNIDLLRGDGLVWVVGVMEVDLDCVGGVSGVGFVVWFFENMFVVMEVDFGVVLGMLFGGVVLNLLLNRLILELKFFLIILLFLEFIVEVCIVDVVLLLVLEEIGVKDLDWFDFGVDIVFGDEDLFVEIRFWFVLGILVFFNGYEEFENNKVFSDGFVGVLLVGGFF